jgi:hypothetical protein
MRYTMYEVGPDHLNTYPECWGKAATRMGREIAAAISLIGLLSAVDRVSHDNWRICGPGGRVVASSRREYYSLPSVARERSHA